MVIWILCNLVVGSVAEWFGCWTCDYLVTGSTPGQGFFCARRDSIERNSYGNVAGWLGVRHTPVLYQNG